MRTRILWLTVVLPLILCLPALGQVHAESLGDTSAVGIAADTTTFVAADLNGDGRDDIVTSIEQRRLIGILLARVDGTFANMPALDAAGSIDTGDFNGDGNRDIICIESTGAGSVALMFPGQGNGTFGPPASTSLRESRYLTQIADFNGDGRPDLLTVATGHVPVAVLLSLPGGYFSEPFEIPTTEGAAIAADFNGDGRLDVIARVPISPFSYFLHLFAGHGDGTFSESMQLSGVPGPDAVGDFDGNGTKDVAGLLYGGEDGYDTATVVIAFGDGHGAFLQPLNLTMPALSAVVRAVADFNGDGRDDLLSIGKAGTAEVRPSSVFLTLGFEGTTPGEPQQYDAFLPGSVRVGDFNGDRLPDIAVGSYAGLGNYSYLLALRFNTKLVTYSASLLLKPGKPFRIALDGANFSTNSSVYIGDSAIAWTQVKLKSHNRLILKGGRELEVQFPPGVEVQIRIENPDGQVAIVSLVR